MQIRNVYHRQGLLEIGKIVASILNKLIGKAQPGITTAWLDNQADILLKSMGATPTPAKDFGFPGRLCISINDEVVHGIPGERILDKGDLVKMDLTASRNGYAADASRMIVLEPGNSHAHDLAECARNACLTAIAKAKTGIRLSDIGAVIEDAVTAKGFQVIRKLYGHGIGRRTHEQPEVPNFNDHNNDNVLHKGMVIAIEPIISAGSGEVHKTEDGWTIVTSDGALSAHYEETVIIGDNGAEVVTVC